MTVNMRRSACLPKLASLSRTTRIFNHQNICHCQNATLGLLAKLAALSLALAAVVKGAPALIPADVAAGWSGLGDAPPTTLAALVIVAPTALNVAKWRQRSREGAAFDGDF